MEFNGKVFVQAINAYVDSMKISKKRAQDNSFTELIIVCHFFCAVFSCITSDSITNLGEDKKIF